MLDSIKNKLNQIKNPVTGLSFEAEKRWLHINLEGDKLVAEYNRDGISPADKRVIEKAIHDALATDMVVENIMIKTVSTQSQDVFKALDSKPAQAPENTAPAQLKVGHGTIDKKKSVPNVKKIIAVGSGKGGVGKSTFTSNLALSLANTGKKVGIIDADIYGPSMPMMFGQRSTKPRSNGEKKILPVEAHGLKIMSFGFFIEENDPVIWRGPMLGGVLNQFLFDVDWGDLDYLVIDLPPGTGDIQLSMIQNAHVDASIVISTPQDIALLDAKKGAEMFKKMNLPIIGMVENMSSFVCSHCNEEHFIFGQGGVETAVKDLGIDFLGKIPLEMELRTGADRGQPYMSQNQLSERPVWKAFTQIADKVNHYFGDHPEAQKPGFFSKILGLNK